VIRLLPAGWGAGSDRPAITHFIRRATNCFSVLPGVAAGFTTFVACHATPPLERLCQSACSAHATEIGRIIKCIEADVGDFPELVAERPPP
jgi:hypothetical protein